MSAPGKSSRGAPGGKPKGGPGKGPASGRAGARTIGLIAFGALLVVLFVGFAVAQGIGQPSVPSGSIAVVEDAASGTSPITQQQFDRALEQTAKRSGLQKVPKPSSPQYKDIKDAAIGDLLDTVWIQSEADEQGIAVTDKQVADELAKIKKQNFQTEAEYRQFIKRSGYNQAEVDLRVKLQLLSTKIQGEITKNAPAVSDSQVQDYYDAAKSQFETPETRDVRLVLNKDKAKVVQAKKALEADDSTTTWNKVAKQYSTDPSSKDNGGLRQGLTEGLVEEPLNGDVFAAEVGQVEGPVKTALGYYVFEVQSVTPASTRPLSEVEAQIRAQLEQQAQQNAFSQFVTNYGTKWRSRTFCASGYVVNRCQNYVGSGHPDGAPPACYEANPKGGIPDACPAPVLQVAPALPGTVTVLTPQGTRLPQRPRPAGLKAAAAGGLQGTLPGTPVTPGGP
ncbi:MAG: peptidyl-prolyl cis-trans isomerase [Solirubrobacterales bacterium]